MKINPPVQIMDHYKQLMASGVALDLQKRLAGADPALWPGDEDVRASIARRLGWLTSTEKMRGQAGRITDFAAVVRESGINHCVLLGMGGSSLAPEVFSHVFGSSSQHSVSLEVLDSTSPKAICNVAERLDWSRTLFIIASKSGTTIESDSLFRYFYQQVANQGRVQPGRQFVAITDEHTPLAELAANENFLDCFINPSDIGGRFSVLSYFGLVPAALVGVDIARLLAQAAGEQDTLCFGGDEVGTATRLGLIMGLSAQSGIDKLLVTIDRPVYPFAHWLEQLVAESTGKDGKGLLPVTTPVCDETDRIGGKMQITLCQSPGEDCAPCYSQSLESYQLGAEFFRWQWATVIAGAVMNINPFDEPNVSENKRVTLEVLEDSDKNANEVLSGDLTLRLSPVGDDNRHESITTASQHLARLLDNADEHDYFAILAYCFDAMAMEDAFREFRCSLLRFRRIASTFGTGPRYLHSTGQLHKGGANNGVFLLLTTGHLVDVEIPGKPYSFADLNNAQAMGDLNVLHARHRRILHLHLPDESPEVMADLKSVLDQALRAKVTPTVPPPY